MTTRPTEPPDSPADHQPDTLATPEGDNEYAANEPLSHTPPTPVRPRGDEPHTSEPLRPALD